MKELAKEFLKKNKIYPYDGSCEVIEQEGELFVFPNEDIERPVVFNPNMEFSGYRDIKFKGEEDCYVVNLKEQEGMPMKDEEETAKMIFQAFNIHPAARWENGRYVNPNEKEDNHEEEKRRPEATESDSHVLSGRGFGKSCAIHLVDGVPVIVGNQDGFKIED